MKRRMTCLAFGFGVLVSQAAAQSMPEDTYLRVFGGASQIFDGGDTGPALAGAAIGVRGGEYSPWAAEIELARRDGEIESTGIMANFLRDIADPGNARIYVGAGIGAVRLEDGGASELNPAAQAMLGTAIELGDTVEFTLELRHIEAGDGPTSASEDQSWTDMTAGLAFEF